VSEGERMAEKQKTVIFREKALRLYHQNQQKIILLRLVRPRLFAYIWGLLACMALLAGLAWTARVPVTVSGIGLVTHLDGSRQSGMAGMAVVSLLPPESLKQLGLEQRVLVRGRDAKTQLVARITRIEPQVLSPEAIRRRFGLSGALAGAVDSPAAVAVARIEAGPAGLDPALYAGSESRIDVEIGSRRVLSVLPGLGSLL
jgi:hypothetical protein